MTDLIKALQALRKLQFDSHAARDNANLRQRKQVEAILSGEARGRSAFEVGVRAFIAGAHYENDRLQSRLDKIIAELTPP